MIWKRSSLTIRMAAGSQCARQIGLLSSKRTARLRSQLIKQSDRLSLDVRQRRKGPGSDPPGMPIASMSYGKISQNVFYYISPLITGTRASSTLDLADKHCRRDLFIKAGHVMSFTSIDQSVATLARSIFLPNLCSCSRYELIRDWCKRQAVLPR